MEIHQVPQEPAENSAHIVNDTTQPSAQAVAAAAALKNAGRDGYHEVFTPYITRKGVKIPPPNGKTVWHFWAKDKAAPSAASSETPPDAKTQQPKVAN